LSEQEFIDYMKPRLKKILLIIIFIVITTFFIFNVNIFYDWFINPFSKILWTIINLFLSIDQRIYWFLVIFGFLFLGIFVIPTIRINSGSQQSKINSEQQNRLDYWKAKIKSAKENDSDRILIEDRLNYFLTIINSESPTHKVNPIKIIPKKREFFGFIKFKMYQILNIFKNQSDRNQYMDDFDLSVHLSLLQIEEALEINNDIINTKSKIRE